MRWLAYCLTVAECSVKVLNFQESHSKLSWIFSSSFIGNHPILFHMFPLPQLVCLVINHNFFYQEPLLCS